MGDSRRGGGSRLVGARRTASAPYQKRRDALGSSNADADGIWKHDRHEGGGSLASRMQAKEVRPRPDLSAVQSALRSAAPDVRGLSIKGAGQPAQPIVEVKGLVSGTTAEDVKAIFQSCGPISKARLSSTSTEQSPHVLLYYENRENALNAVTKFNGLPADGQKLVVVLASQNLSIQERVYSAGKNDDILATEQPSGKMYSDDIVASDPRAQVVMGDFTVDEPARGRGRGGGRGRRGRVGRRSGATGGRMDVDI
ncbi:hypothetical protein JB92DRAFT_2821718 [Gautieria morchelliformis]|nr:hypothetical protein JB92DRAFT_2821718 [Gautieria morchelliformis]